MRVENDPLVLLAWSRVFSPVADERLCKEAWEQLGLPGDWKLLQPAFWSTFHIGMPQPPASALTHVLLGVDGGGMREDVVRILEYLDLNWGNFRLPPDHLACLLELLGIASAEDEEVLADGIRDRYVIPWCERALAVTKQLPAMNDIVAKLRDDVQAVGFSDLSHH